MQNEGVIIRIITKKGYGFLRQEDGNEIFFHVSNCLVPWEMLKEGMMVSFAEIVIDPRSGRPKAVGVQTVEEVPSSTEVGIAK